MRVARSLFGLIGRAGRALEPVLAAEEAAAGATQSCARMRPGALPPRSPRMRLGRSPDGRHLALVAPRGLGLALHVNGRPVHPRVGGALLEGPPVFSSDGRQVAILERRDHTLLLVVVGLGSRPRARSFLLPESWRGVRPFWLPDGAIGVGRRAARPRVLVRSGEPTGWAAALPAAPLAPLC
jgi:hypothetical protein